MVASFVFVVISFLILLEGLFVFAFPHKTGDLMRRMSKDRNSLRALGFIEFVIGLLLFILAVSLRGS